MVPPCVPVYCSKIGQRKQGTLRKRKDLYFANQEYAFYEVQRKSFHIYMFLLRCGAQTGAANEIEGEGLQDTGNENAYP